MPEGEHFWNPYRWVTASNKPVDHSTPQYHHHFSGLSGYLLCRIETLTPLVIGDGKDGFVQHPHNRKPYVPATSLKGAIRSLAEIVGNAAVPSENMKVDPTHDFSKAKARAGSGLDTTARMFGYLNKQEAFAGLVRFSDAEIEDSPSSPQQWKRYPVVVGQPRKTHDAFYPDDRRRKLYHHQVGAQQPTPPPSSVRQTKKVQVAPPGTIFSFTVHFENLREGEFDLLLYCIALEEQCVVNLSVAALGYDTREGGTTLCGPLRHKLGGAKPSGAGSVCIRVTRLMLRREPAARYLGNDLARVWEGAALDAEVKARIEHFSNRTDATMRELRAMLIYCTNDPRTRIRYPTRDWFNKNSMVPLKPTI